MSLTLLAATDFSAPARHALERAAQLAAAHEGARLTISHVLSTSSLARLGSVMGEEAVLFRQRVAGRPRRRLPSWQAA